MTISTQRLRFLRGNSTAAGAFTGLQGELIFDTTLYTLRLQDGVTPGGYTLARASDVANVAANANYGNTNVAAYLTSYTGNLSAGNIFSNNYLYANGVSILTDIQSNYGNSNVVALLSSFGSNTLSTTGNVTAATFVGSGVTAGAANAVVSLNAFDTDDNTVSIQAQGNTAAAVIESYSTAGNNRWTWSFDNSGTLNFPRSQTSIFGGMDNDLTINTTNTNVGTVYTFTFTQFGTLNVPVNLDVAGNIYTSHIVGTGSGNVAITANTQSWLFDDNGTITLPSASQIRSVGNTGVRLSAGASDATGLFLNNTGDADLYANANVSIYTDSGNTGWTFDTDGNLTIPGSILAEFVTSPAPKITGFDINSTRVMVNGNVTATNFIGNIQGPSTVFGNLNVTGNLIVSGNTITVSTNNFVVSDNIIFMANNNPANILDIGFAAHYTTDTLRHTGFVKDVNDSTWKLFSNVPQEITTTVDFTDAIYDPILTGNITAPYFIGNGALLTGLSTTYSNANVASYLPTYTGNISAANISLTDNTSALTFNTGAYIYGDTVTRPGSVFLQPNTSVAGFPSVVIGGAGRLAAPNGSVHAIFNTADLTVQVPLKVTSATAATSTSTGALTVSGGAGIVGNVYAGGAVVATGNITGNFFIGNGALLTGIAASSNYGNANVAAYLTTYGGPVNANVITGTANATINGLVVNASATIGTTLGVTGNITSEANVTVTGNVVASTFVTTGTGGNITGVNIVYGNLIGSGNTTVQEFTVNSNATVGGTVGITGNVVVSGTGAISTPNLPSFRVYGTVSTQITANTTISATQSVLVDYNQGSYYNNTTGVFTAPLAGLYHCYATVRVGNNNGLNQVTIQKNSNTSGANVIAFWETDTNIGSAIHFSMTGYAKCVAGDTIRLHVLTGNVNFDSNDSWGVTFIG